MITWPTIKSALRQLAIRGTGINPQRVIWARGSGPREGGPWMDVNIQSVQVIGRDGRIVETRQLPVAPGEEIALKAIGTRRMTVSYRLFAAAGGGDPPEGILTGMVSRSYLDSSLVMLREAGIGMSGWSPVLTMTEVMNSTFQEPRAQVSLVSFLSSEVEEFTTFIESVELHVNDRTRIVDQGDFDE
jgi:hypothetical protein